MIKIAFLSFYQNKVSRGVENWLNDLSLHLDTQIKTKIFFPQKFNDSFEDYSSSFLRKLFLDPYSLTILNHTRKIFSQLKEFDIIVPLNGGWQVLLAKLASKLYKKKILIVGQSGLGYDDRWNLFWKPDLFVALTKAQASWARKYYSGTIAIIPNAVDLNKFKPNGKKIKINLKPPIIFCAASLQKMDFFKNLILAIAKTKFSLLIAGSGDKKQEKEIDSLGQRYLSERYLRRQFKYSQMPLAYRSVDLFVYPNPKYESFGIVFLEAMASNLPVIATDDPIRREIIGNSGLFINSSDFQSIFTQIEKAFKINWKKKPLQQASKFSWIKIAKKYDEIFRKLVK